MPENSGKTCIIDGKTHTFREKINRGRLNYYIFAVKKKREQAMKKLSMTKNLGKFTLLIIALLLGTERDGDLWGQVVDDAKMSVLSFEPRPTDMDAKVNYPEEDWNGNTCAIIKVYTTKQGFSFDTGTISITKTIQKKGEVWVYVSPGVRKFRISHADYKPCDYEFPFSIQSGSVYALDLLTEATTSSAPTNTLAVGFLKLKTNPSECTIRVGKTQEYEIETKRITDGNYNKRLGYGRYYYKVDAPFYETDLGMIDFQKTSEPININLRKAYNTLRINSTPEFGAEVTIRNILTGQETSGNIPFKSTEKFAKGDYIITITNNGYATIEQQITLNGDGTSREYSYVLAPQFNYLKINSLPEPGASVIIHNVLTGQETAGKTPFNPSSKFTMGEYNITVFHDDYATVEKSIKLTGDGTLKEFDIPMMAQYATVTCKCAAADAQIWIDDEFKATGSWSGRLSGNYTHILEARKENHTVQSITFTVTNGETKTINVDAPKPRMGILEVTAIPEVVSVKVDGKPFGETPTINEIIIGSHRVEVLADGYQAQLYDIIVQEGQSYTLEAILEKSAVSGRAAATGSPDGIKTYTVNGVSFNMVNVEGGTFEMGNTFIPADVCGYDEVPVHSVTLSSYLIGQTEVTEALWKAVMGRYSGYTNRDSEYPAYYITYDKCITFISRLNSMTGENFRLPTEAEWEYAARGGKYSNGYKYSGSDNLDDVAWHKDNSGGNPNPVATKQANELGIYDMSGNVLEWCSDLYGTYGSFAQIDPQGPCYGLKHVSRGGHWNGSLDTSIVFDDFCVTQRNSHTPDFGTSVIGLRLALGTNSGTTTVSNTVNRIASLEKLKSYGKIKTFTVNGVSFNMVSVKGGTFTMGATTEQVSDAESNESPAHTVKLSSYSIGQTEVTQELWEAVMGDNPSTDMNLEYPISSITYDDCLAFIEKLNSLTGKRFRLPTEAEWEYAARGGQESKGYKYSGSNSIDDVAWYQNNTGSEHGLNIVASKQANELGIYDMSGNVKEWCSDWYGTYSSNKQTNPKGPQNGIRRVVRGGYKVSRAKYCRVSCRSSSEPDYKYPYSMGLRLVLQ